MAKKNGKKAPEVKAPKVRRRKQKERPVQGFSMQKANGEREFRQDVRDRVDTLLDDADNGNIVTVKVEDGKTLATAKAVMKLDTETYCVSVVRNEDRNIRFVRFWNRLERQRKLFGDDPHADFKAKYLTNGGTAKKAA